MTNKILITGSQGALASYLIPLFYSENLFLGTRENLDIANKKMVDKVIGKVKPKIIIHLAAATNVDKCESDPDYANSINYLGTKNLVEAAKKIDATFLYMSTGAVFNGNKKFYLENDTPSPINEYGNSKLAGENFVKNHLDKFYIVRCGWLIGGGNKEKKFLSQILEQVREGKKEILAVSDIYGSIAYGKDLAKFLKFISKSKKYGIYHFSSKGSCSRYELASYFLKKMNVMVKVVPVLSSEFSSKTYAPRPRHEVVRSTFKYYNSHWKETIRHYIKDELSKY